MGQLPFADLIPLLNMVSRIHPKCDVRFSNNRGTSKTEGVLFRVHLKPSKIALWSVRLIREPPTVGKPSRVPTPPTVPTAMSK